ncbi:MAG: ATP-binding cassette domain-containing protein [Candidatus Lokiarchaeota archaeon]|nr:ATP-binding cassette domain-containing protein [Candidatus Lokiarchaeota archaeon]
MVKVELKHLSREFDDGTRIGPINLTVKEGELLTLLGPSGSGKTTTLRMVAGFIPITEGDLLFDNRSVKGIPPRDRNIGMVFQSIALFPNMNVFQNIAFSLEMANQPRPRIIKRVEELARMLGIETLLHRNINEISGGEAQRVALARALARNPKLLLLDEPFSALDPQLREKLQFELRKIQQSLKITTIFVTHSQQEAFAISDRIAVLNDGIVVQVGTPNELYEHPASDFIAKFIGFGNVIKASVVSTCRTGSEIEFYGLKFQLDRKIDTSEVLLSVKPEDVVVSITEKPEMTKGTLVTVTPQVGNIRLVIEVGEQRVLASVENELDMIEGLIGKEIYFKIREGQLQVLEP